MFAVITAPFSIWAAQHGHGPLWVVAAVMATIIAAAALITLARKAWLFYSWKRSVNRFINGLADTDETIECTDGFISFTTSQNVTIARWESVQSISIDSSSIKIVLPEETHYLPAAAIEAQQYIMLSEFIKRKLNNLSGDPEKG